MKPFLLVVGLVVVLATTSTVDAGAATRLAGDADCDLEVTARDAALQLQFGAGLAKDVPCHENADVEPDGYIGSVDALHVLQFTAGLTPRMPRGPIYQPSVAFNRIIDWILQPHPGPGEHAYIEHLAECKLEWVIPGLQFGYAVIWLVTCPDVIVNGVWVSVQACFDETADRVQWCYGLPPPHPGH